MNKYVVVLKGTNKDLATFEFETLFKTYFNEEIKLKQIKNTIYYFESKCKVDSKDFFKRLTFTNFIGDYFLEFEKYEELLNYVNNNDFSYLENKPFSVISKKGNKDDELTIANKELAKPMWDSLKTPKVNLEEPEIIFRFFFTDKKITFSREIYFNSRDYLRRMPKLRPVVMPYTLKSDMARASINLLSIKEGSLLDPFCGIGGILLEGYDMGFNVIGNDISWNDLKYFKKNFEHFYPNSNVSRILADCRSNFLKENSIDGIVTDIPYGKSSRKLGIGLYEDFLKLSKKALKPGSKLVVIYANFVEFKEIALKYFIEVKEIDQYINRSMTRHILILENNK